MIHIKEVIVVEGKYDKEKLKKVTDAPIICTHGFELYRSKAIVNSIRSLAADRGVIVLTDSDSAGFRIRNYLKSCLGRDCVIKNAYIPAVKGKERRKNKPGREGLLGVEGIDEEVLKRILTVAASGNDLSPEIIPVTKADFFEAGLSGREDSALLRRRLAKHLCLPPRISANALLELINQTGGREIYQKALKELKINNAKSSTIS